MQRVSWNDSWAVLKPGETPLIATVMGTGEGGGITLPHDAMILEKKTETTKNQHQTGFYPGGCYTYIKNFTAPEQWRNQNVTVEFEGVYCNARVYVNGDYAGGHPNGYTEFSVCLDDYLHYGEINELKVIANNTEENSRWYSGSGIYRNVNLLAAGYVHIKNNGVKVLTKNADEELAVLQIETKVENTANGQHKLSVRTEVIDSEGKVVSVDIVPVTIYGREVEAIRQVLLVEEPMLWCPESPNLYCVQVTVEENGQALDSFTDTFGIRTVTVDARRGLRINGKEVKLRGTCIHHDNGVIGAVTLERAEERRCLQLKEAGFNCIRSAHHPMSRAMLKVCDEQGMLVMDELTDCWTRSKNNNDYAEKFPYHWQTDVERMIDKDFNHPCVILYCSGNEIQEASSAQGARWNRLITQKFHELDDSRPVTVAINGMLACMDSMMEIVSDALGIPMEQMMGGAPQEEEQPAGDNSVGSDAANGIAAILKGPAADAMCTNQKMTDRIDEFVSVTDVVGYNYMTARHEFEQTLHPSHVVLGTETFPADIARLWRVVKNNKHVIGDMTWTGYDYLGEAGSNFFYYDGRSGFAPNWPISLACMGDIDIIGDRKPISFYREIVYGLRKAPYIGVEDPVHYGVTPNVSAWGFKDDIGSWTWHGFEGKPVVVNVYSNSDEVELFYNGVSLGKKETGDKHDHYATFECVYEPGILKAVAWRDGRPAEEFQLETAGEKVQLDVRTDRTELKAGGADLAFVSIRLLDEQNRENLQAQKNVTVTVEGAGTLQGFGSADPETLNAYDNNIWDTFHGHLLAVVRTAKQPGEITVTVSAEGCETRKLILKVAE